MADLLRGNISLRSAITPGSVIEERFERSDTMFDLIREVIRFCQIVAKGMEMKLRINTLLDGFDAIRIALKRLSHDKYRNGEIQICNQVDVLIDVFEC
jgi:hypothetical protein